MVFNVDPIAAKTSVDESAPVWHGVEIQNRSMSSYLYDYLLGALSNILPFQKIKLLTTSDTLIRATGDGPAAPALEARDTPVVKSFYRGTRHPVQHRPV